MLGFSWDIQSEEINYGSWDGLMDMLDTMGSVDVLDRCEVVSLEELKTSSSSYRMEDVVEEDIENQWLWDQNMDLEFIGEFCGLPKIGNGCVFIGGMI